MFIRSVLLPIAAGLVAALVGCAEDEELLPARHRNGSPAASEPSAEPTAFPGDGSLAPAGLIRLTNAQYRRTIRDLLGPELVLTERLPRDSVNGIGFPTAPPITSLDLYRFSRVGEQVASFTQTKLPPGITCSIAADTCVEELARVFGRRAFRRPLTLEEVAASVTVFQTAVTSWGYSREEAAGFMVRSILMQPDVLYRTELGDKDAKVEDGSVALSSLELASRLSYLIWGSTPDEELLALGESGALRDPTTLAQQAERLLTDARSIDGLGDFFVYWLGLDALPDKSKSGDRWFGFYLQSPQERMLGEVRTLTVSALRRGDTIGQLLSTREAYVDDLTRQTYDLPALQASGMTTTILDGPLRSGLLTRAAFLATHAYGDQSAPIRRGKAIRVRMLCQPLPPPPNDALINLPQAPCGATPREDTELKTSPKSCQGCHALINPLGYAFEHFDQGGAYRASFTVPSPGAGGCDGPIVTKPVDASGTLTGTSADGPFTNAEELEARLAQTKELKECFARQLYRFGTSRGENGGDAANIASLAETMTTTNGKMRAVLTAFVTSPAFMRRPVQ